MTKLLTIVEFDIFANKVGKLISEQERDDVVSYLAYDPLVGDEIPGTGGLRKVRFKRHNKGKSGGYRVIYYFYNDFAPLYLLDVYAKSDQQDLSSERKQELSKIAKVFKTECRKRYEEKNQR